MSLFKKIFCGSDPISPLRKALSQRRWADALAMGETLDRTALTPEAVTELDSLLVAAGDGLAELNLAEGEGCLRGGDRARATEHLDLAASQVRSEHLSQRIAQVRLLLTPRAEKVSALPAAPAAMHDCGSSCTSTGCLDGPMDTTPPEQDIDAHTRLELVLGSYPSEWAVRYQETSEGFREAFLLAHEGHEQEALELFERISEGERNDLFYFERGALLGRLGEIDRGCRDMERALALNPNHGLALETLITLEISGGREDAARKRLENMLDREVAIAFCHEGLAEIFARLGHGEKALHHGRMAIAEGSRQPATLLLTASLLEQNGLTEEAEEVLKCISGGGGCSGGISIPLAEFWLRQGTHMDKALEAFKGALRQEPGRPRWAMRIAQIYLARGWKNEGLALLEKTLDDPDLEPDLRQEGITLLSASK